MTGKSGPPREQCTYTKEVLDARGVANEATLMHPACSSTRFCQSEPATTQPVLRPPRVISCEAARHSKIEDPQVIEGGTALSVIGAEQLATPSDRPPVQWPAFTKAVHGARFAVSWEDTDCRSTEAQPEVVGSSEPQTP